MISVEKRLSTLSIRRFSARFFTWRSPCRRLLLLFVSLFMVFPAVSMDTLPHNFHQVTPELFRSSQPDAIGMRALERTGIRTVLNLRQWHSDKDEAKGTSLILYHVGINTAAFSEQDIVAALRILHRAVKPALVHCWHGSDRTGLIVALYRLLFDGASKSEVLTELRHPDHGHHERFYPAIARYIETVDVASLRQKVLATPTTP